MIRYLQFLAIIILITLCVGTIAWVIEKIGQYWAETMISLDIWC